MAEGLASDPDLGLPPEFRDTPILILRATSRRKIALFLDLDGYVIVGNNGSEPIDIINDYNGLAELAGFSSLEINNLKLRRSPTEELLHQWGTAGSGATVGLLWQYLTLMDRMDVITDCRRSILQDCMMHKEQRQREDIAPVQDPAISNSEMDIDETRYAALDDVRTGKRTHYDAFVCYTMENATDRAFVRDMIENIEGKRHLKLFVPGRDDLPGSADHTITAYLIECRCKRVVIVMSPAFLKSPACEFQVKFAHALAPGARSKKLIPIIRHSNIVMPRILKFLAICDFTKLDMNDWVWERLATALMAPVGLINDFPSFKENSDEGNDEGVEPTDLKSIRYPQQPEPDSGSSPQSGSPSGAFSDTLPKTNACATSASSSRSASLDSASAFSSTSLLPRGPQSETHRRFKPASAQQFNSEIVRTSRTSDDTEVMSHVTPQSAGQEPEAQESDDDEKTVIFRDRKCQQF